jgi:hypothetical protein
MMKRLLLIGIALLLTSCGEDKTLVVTPDPLPTPSPTPTPAADICEALRADIFATVEGEAAFSWALGQVATLTASITYRGDLMEDVDTSECESLNVVTWTLPHAPQPYCEAQGNLNSSRIRLQCFEPGTITVKATPQGFTVLPAEANFRVQPSDLVAPLAADFFLLNPNGR